MTRRRLAWLIGRRRMKRHDSEGAAMPAVFKQEAHALIDALPETATWSDLAEQVELILDIKAGTADGMADRVTDNDQVRREFGLPSLR